METKKDVALMSKDLALVHSFDTIPGLFWNRVTTQANNVALREKDFGIWNEITWEQYGEQARLIGLGLKALGMGRGDVCSIASEINKEWIFADLGIICAGGVCNGVYPTDASNQVEYLINDSGTRFYFAEDEEQLDKVLEVRERTPTLQKIIIFDMEGLRSFDDEQCMSLVQLIDLGRDYLARHPDVWAEEIEAANPGDLMILTYTSGTTGMPKGAMISQRNMMVMLNYLKEGLDAHAGDEQLGFLPLAHIAGRIFYTFSPLQSLATVNLVESLETTVQDMQEVSPTLHFAVPRVWEKQYSTVAIKLKEATALGRLAYEWAIATGHRAASYRKQKKALPGALKVLNGIADLLVLRNVRKALGINNARRLFTGAAPIAPDLINWYWALNRPMFEVFGQTENTGLVTTNTPEHCRIGSVGKPIADVQIRISDQGEILIKGDSVIDGYWRKPEKTAETIINGWLHTGDVGRIDEDGFVYLIDRMKDIIITAGGKNITPSEIENQLKFSPFISDAVVVGDKRPYLTCLIMIDQENVTKFAQDEDVVFTNYLSLCHTREVNDLIGREIENVNQKFARVETIKKYRLIDQLLDPEDEELTPTMKLKRKVVNVKYADLIDSMYKN
jgi:long-chain acyl-CoA synthetase